MLRQRTASCMCKAGEPQQACCCNGPSPCPSTSHLPWPSKSSCILCAAFVLAPHASPFSLSNGCTLDLCHWEKQNLAVCQLCHSLSVSASGQKPACPGYADDCILCHVFVMHSLACCWQSFHCYMFLHQVSTPDTKRQLQDPVIEGAATILRFSRRPACWLQSNSHCDGHGFRRNTSGVAGSC